MRCTGLTILADISAALAPQIQTVCKHGTTCRGIDYGYQLAASQPMQRPGIHERECTLLFR